MSLAWCPAFALDARSDAQASIAAERRVLTTLYRRHPELGWRPGSLFDRPTEAVPSGG